MAYIDGFMLAVAASDREKYTEFSRAMSEKFKFYGALSAVEGWGDDVSDRAAAVSMPKAVALKEGEVVCFSWVVWPDKAARDAGTAAFLADPFIIAAHDDVPFDMERVILGGFEVIVEV